MFRSCRFPYIKLSFVAFRCGAAEAQWGQHGLSEEEELEPPGISNELCSAGIDSFSCI